VRDHGRDMVWFRVNIGRERNADPRWLLPLLCRAGDVTKSEIGAIRIFDRDTRFEIAAEFADKFEAAARTMKPNEARIARVEGPGRNDAVPMHATPAPKHDKDKAATTGAQKDARGKAPWRDRAKGKAGDRPHGKGGKPKSHRKGPRPHATAPTSTGAAKPASKYADKKRAAPQT
jgi:ATP-dependent RNA helicase DeaD